ncbi:MAG TPA: adenylate/guanylate cyclase domain-containing protein [Gaiellaceae bacterium]|nr:adenylate/guanylate cyclase domain-containing protein [Gaiellaceae bacterium]
MTRTDLPSGEVTLLFTDVEGSTRLLRALGAEAYAEALAEHRRAIRAACAAHEGAEVDTQGDAFFLAFPTASGALAAAEAFTAALSAGPIRVRAGVHTGTPLLAEEGYVGEDVHRAARIAAAGHGGQVLVSAATAVLVDHSLTDLGDHRFKDLSAPERVFQLGDGAFPPLASLYRTNLPVPSTSFLGREHELAEVAGLLREDGVTLVTLTGPGGTGKTRLAVHAAAEAAESFRDGIWWVPLSPLHDADLVLSSVAQALEVEDQPGQTLADGVAARLQGRRALVILDNAEHLMPEVASEIAGLRATAGPSLLVTSRERLQLQGEHVYPVPSLDQEDGVELFVARARSLGSAVEESEAVAELCARLDNLPLALELAAARTVVFSPVQLVERLSERLDLLKAGRDADPRQQTLRATIEWSYDLLEQDEQRLFRALSVFAGSCNFEAAETVCAADPDVLQSLLDKSLLRRREEYGQTRYWMLETIRELAGEQLAAAGEGADLRRRHAEHYLDVARSANLAADAEGPQRHDLVIPERDNMRAALSWALESGEREVGLELVVALENYWATSLPAEGLEWAVVLLEEDGGVPPALTVRALRVKGGMENALGQLDASEASWERALPIARGLGDDRAVATLLHRFSHTGMRRNDVARVRELAEESLAGHRRAGGFAKGEAQALGSLAWAALREGDHERSLELLHESCALAGEAGFRWWQAGMLTNIGVVSIELGRIDDARESVRQALAISRGMHDRRGTVYQLRLLAEMAARTDGERLAGTLAGAAEAENERIPVGRYIHEWREPASLDDQTGPDFAAGREEGRELSLDDAVAVALAT